MDETRIDKEVCLIEEDDISLPVKKVTKQKRKVDTDLIARARSMYITTDLSINSIADQLGINKFTLQNYCQTEKWSLLKQQPEFADWSLEIVNEIYEKIDFYSDTQKILHALLLNPEFQTPKDIKLVVDAYKVADERMTALRLIKENGNKENGTEY